MVPVPLAVLLRNGLRLSLIWTIISKGTSVSYILFVGHVVLSTLAQIVQFLRISMCVSPEFSLPGLVCWQLLREGLGLMVIGRLVECGGVIVWGMSCLEDISSLPRRS